MTDQGDFFPDQKVVAEATQNLAALASLGSCISVVFEAIKRQGDDGVTSAILLEMFPNMAYSTVTTAPSKLLKRGLIYRRGDTQTGKNGRTCMVIRVNRRIEQQLQLIPGRRKGDLF